MPPKPSTPTFSIGYLRQVALVLFDLAPDLAESLSGKTPDRTIAVLILDRLIDKGPLRTHRIVVQCTKVCLGWRDNSVDLHIGTKYCRTPVTVVIHFS